jgi:hypothetical protein
LSDNEPSKVVPFKVVHNEAFMVEPAVTSATPSEDQENMRRCVEELSKFMAENADNIRYFVSGIAMQADPLDDKSNVTFHMFTSPMSMPDLAMTIKMFENTLYNRLNAGEY